jgi:HAMP domain-containing protein
MSILLLTAFLSVLLAALFVAWFVQERANSSLRSPEQDALLPLDNDVNEKTNA